MRRFSSHWLLSLLMAVVLAITVPVAAGGDHGDVSCLESLAMQDQVGAWDTLEMAEPSESHSSEGSSCCIPCALCAASMAWVNAGAVVPSILLAGPGLGNPSGTSAPMERPPRV